MKKKETNLHLVIVRLTAGQLGRLQRVLLAGMRRFTGRYAASVSRSAIWAADTRQTGYGLFW